ncbi:MAG: PAS domain S-box protein [Phycisphaerae bacterium]|jgi:PAS domain S-box-containing protein
MAVREVPIERYAVYLLVGWTAAIAATAVWGATGTGQGLLPVRCMLLWLIGVVGLGCAWWQFRKRVAERTDAEAEVRRLAAIVASSSDAIIAEDLTGRIVSWNAGAERLYGYAAAEILGQPVARLIPESRLTEAVELRTGAIRRAPSGQIETACCARDGAEIPVSATVSPIEDARGHVVGISSIMRDISGHKRAEQALRQQINELFAIFNGLEGAVYVADMETHEVLAVNRYVVEHFGDSAGQRCYEMFQEGQTGECPFCTNALLVDDVGRPQPPVVWEQWNPRTQRWYQCVDRAIRWPDGRLVRMEIALDITARKHAEEHQRKFLTRMQSARKLESLVELAGGIAHDFNNLLVGVLGNASMLLEDLPPKSPARELAQRIARAAQRAADLTRQMLAYSGKGRLDVTPVDLSELARDLEDLLRAVVSRRATFAGDFATAVPAVEIDTAQVRRVLVSLVTNAAEAMGERAGHVCAQTGVAESAVDDPPEAWFGGEPPRGRYVYFEVADDGCGMDAETRARIFDPFFTTKFKGRGLGLAAVLGIVRAHGGAIRVQSEPGAGTTIRIAFPVAGTVAAPVEPPAEMETTMAGDRAGTVLVVDDEETVRELAQTALERSGFHVMTADNGPEALELFRAHMDEIDVVLLDLTMPGLPGHDVCRELHRMRVALPVVISSGYSEEDARRQLSCCRPAAFIQKPYRPGHMVGELRQAMEGACTPAYCGARP